MRRLSVQQPFNRKASNDNHYTINITQIPRRHIVRSFGSDHRTIGHCTICTQFSSFHPRAHTSLTLNALLFYAQNPGNNRQLAALASPPCARHIARSEYIEGRHNVCWWSGRGIGTDLWSDSERKQYRAASQYLVYVRWRYAVDGFCMCVSVCMYTPSLRTQNISIQIHYLFAHPYKRGQRGSPPSSARSACGDQAQRYTETKR